MAETTLKTYEEFTGGTQMTPEKIKAYSQYVKTFVESLGRQPQQTSDVWPYSKTN